MSSRIIRPGRHQLADDYMVEFTKGLCHKLNNLLTVFHGYSGLLLIEPSLSADTRDSINEIKRAADSCSVLMERTMTATRRIPEPQSIDLEKEVLDKLPVEMDPPLPQNIELKIHPPRQLPEVLAAGVLMRRCLIELVRNAADAYGDDGGGEIIVATAAKAGEGRIVIEVRDRAGGLPSQVEDRVFEPFVTTKKETGCFGLGLTIANALLRQMNGALEIETTPGKGCAARMILHT